MMNWNTLLSAHRYHPGSPASLFHSHDRSQFQRDYDRLIFSSPFRRLQNKTQVFPLPGNIFVHNRLTHSLEVASVGRSLGNKIAQFLKQNRIQMENPELLEEIGTIVSSACLAHDLGNPPFGHSGEEAISYFFSEGEGRYFKKLLSDEEWTDLSHFEGNANAFRLLTHSFNGRRPGGYTMTYTTLASIVKYPFESTCATHKGFKYGFFQSEKEIFRQVAEELGLLQVEEHPLQYVRHPLVYLVEAADDICYQIMDIEDSHKMRILSYDETTAILENFYDKNEDKEDLKIIARTFKVVTDKNERIAFLRAGIINKLINACADVFCNNYEAIMDGTFKSTLIKNLSGTNKEAYDKCTDLAYSRIYHTDIVTQIQIAGFKILGTILKEYTDAVLKPETYYARNILSVMPEQYQVSKENSMYTKIQTVVDYVSGMTDSYALNLYRKIKGIELPELK
ncbi:dehydrogenase [Odoribacter laneus]|jgi:putative dGTPase|uniref:Putative dGTPase n=2 Tax=Odoribacter laneus TaxID=626933 RepID=H1DHL1_9BACT|nr:deoxyguanosinetriphosphate triphosphohydrolase [Odoribacter laneus]EHP47140.1 putative dGTPase [Odoribacter laneus YIT 12061]GKI21811.1 dehydrogenase [Odoribacter laneus]GKI26393.1 dehydrogenase [Odoribacter laneus]CCZ82492.1 putative dGTPase [Odoribacter laneus CAG:561]